MASEEDDQTGVGEVGAENPRTRVRLSEPADLEGAALSAEEAFGLAYERLRELSRVARRPSVAVVAVGPRGQLVDGQLVEPREALTIGRHSECGLRLRDRSVSLRHLAAHVIDEGGLQPVVRLWDLNTGQGFRTEDGRASAAVIAEGLLYAQVGSFAVLLTPTATLRQKGTAGEAWAALPPRSFIDRRDEPEPVPAPPGEEPEQRFATRVTTVRPASTLGEGAGPPWAELKLRYGHGKQKDVPISLEHLHRGVLLGRYDRCGVQLTVEENISRVHLLLVRIGADVWAIDTASTNGTTRADGKVVSATVLGPEEWLELGSTGVKVSLKRLQHAAA